MITKLQNLILFCSAIFVCTSLQAADSLYVDVSGNVGIGTSTPTQKLQVEGDNNPTVWVNSTSPVVAERAMFILSNLGKTRFLITNGPDAWTFDNAGNNFQINKAGTGLPVEFQVFDNGDGYFGGDVYAQSVMLTSSRERKTDFEPVDGKIVLEKLATLDVSSWRYKGELASTRHIGPIAEDFLEVFEMGNGTHISTVDTTGIAFAAIKSLRSEGIEQAAELEYLRTENEQLAAANENLEQRLERLETLILGNDLLTSK
jgi:hypothetical protein